MCMCMCMLCMLNMYNMLSILNMYNMLCMLNMCMCMHMLCMLCMCMYVHVACSMCMCMCMCMLHVCACDCVFSGLLAARAATSALRSWFDRHALQLNIDPQDAMGTAFAYAHTEVRRALVAKYESLGTPLIVHSRGFLLEQDGEPVDGGTTATIIALIQGHLLVVANVGDSECVLGGTLSDGSIGFEQLCTDHSPLSAHEYMRVRPSTSITHPPATPSCAPLACAW